MPVRSPERYGRSRRLAMMPSSVAPTRLSQPLASASLVVAGESRMRLACAEILARRTARSRLRRSLSGSSSERRAVGVGQQVEHDQQRRRLAGELRDRGSRPDGCAAAARRTRTRRRSAPRSRRRARMLVALSSRDRFDELGKIARQRLARLRLQLDLVAVAKHQAAKAVPFRLVLPFRRRPGSRRPTALPWAGTADAMQASWQGLDTCVRH